MNEMCKKPTPCPSHTGKTCGHAVLYGPCACWRRDGRPERCAGLVDEPSPLAYAENEERGVFW